MHSKQSMNLVLLSNSLDYEDRNQHFSGYFICYTHCYPTRTVMVTIYVTGDMIELLYLITTSKIS